MFRRYKTARRSTNIVFVIFRLMLSLVMFGVLLGGVYSAYKHFSGFDPLKLDSQAVISREFLAVLSSLKLKTGISQPKETTKPVDPKKLFSFLLLADSHNDNLNLRKALTEAMAKNPQFIIGLGDYSDVGTTRELENTKKELDNSGVRYFLIPGDHDLWDSRDKQLDPGSNFRAVFGLTYQSFTYDNFKFILLFNSDNYLGMREEQINWLTEELEKAKQEQSSGVFVLVHEPLYHPSSDHVMGRVETSLKQQAKNLTYQLKDGGVKKVFAGDIHYFSEYEEPVTKIPMVTVGAISAERNPQAPRYAVVSVFENGNSVVEDIEIK